MFDRIAFVLGEALTAMRRNGFMSFAAVTTVAVALFLMGGAGYAYWRAVQYADTIPGKFDMRVFLKDGTDYATITATAGKIRDIPGVASVNWMPKDKVWELEKQRSPELTEGIENPYPDAYKVTITDLSKGAVIASAIQALDPVEEEEGVQYLQAEQLAVDQGIRILRWLGTGVGGLLLVTAGVLIFNAIRLAVIARQLEIRIMRLVGASPATVFLPFIIEGAVQGILGGFLAAGLLFMANHQFGQYLRTLAETSSLPEFPLLRAMLLLGLIGGAYGMLCSTLSLKARNEGR